MNLELRRAAILLPDFDHDVFVPWASCGLDATSLHRLRLPTEDLRRALETHEAGVFWTGDACRELTPYFSRREASMLEHLLLFPFSSKDGLQAVLVVTDSPYFDGRTEYLGIILAAIAEPAAKAIHEERHAYAQIMRQAIVFKTSDIGPLSERVAANAPRGVRVVLLELADVVSQIATSNDLLDPFRVRQDVLRRIASLFASTGSVCDADGHRALLLLHGTAEEDTELLVQHVAADLAYLMPELSGVPVLRFATGTYPEESTDLHGLIDALL